MPFPYDKYPWLNFQDLNLAYFIRHFREIFQQWDQLYHDLTDWKEATDEDLAEWKAAVESGLDSWKAGVEAGQSAWETATLEALQAWQTAFETLFNTTFTNLSQIKTDAEAARDAALAAQAAAEAAADSVTASATQIALNRNNIAALLNALRVDSAITHEWRDGGISSGTGGTNNNTNRISSAGYVHNDGTVGVFVEVPSGYKAIAYLYENQTISGGSYKGQYSTGWFTEDFIIPHVWNYFKLVFSYTDDSMIHKEDAPTITIANINVTDTSLTASGKAADSFTVGAQLSSILSSLSTIDDNAIQLASFTGGTYLANQESNTICRIGNISSILDVPPDLAGSSRYAWLLTIRPASGNAFQKLYMSAHQHEWIRFYSVSSGNWTNWLTAADDGEIPKYVAIGASTTVGAIHNRGTAVDPDVVTYTTKYAYPNYVGEVLHLNTVNRGVGTTGFIARGSTGSSENFMDVVYNHPDDFTGAALISLEFGYGNDRTAGLPIGDFNDYYPYDETGYHPSGSAGIIEMLDKGATLFGCLNWIIKYLGDHYPQAQLVIIFGAPRANENKVPHIAAQSGGGSGGVVPYKITFDSTTPGTLGEEFEKLKAAINIPMYNLMYNGGGPFTYYQMYAKNPDGTYAIFSTTGDAEADPSTWLWNGHPNLVGYEMYCRFIAGIIISAFKH